MKLSIHLMFFNYPQARIKEIMGELAWVAPAMLQKPLCSILDCLRRVTVYNSPFPWYDWSRLQWSGEPTALPPQYLQPLLVDYPWWTWMEDGDDVLGTRPVWWGHPENSHVRSEIEGHDGLLKRCI